MIDRSGEINIHAIYLMLGSACNFKCRYCLQSNMNNCITMSEPTEEVYQYIEHLVRLQPDYLTDKLTLMFWGGEPLLYFDVIKKVVDRLRDKVEYAIVTNGSLITNKLVRYFNKYNIHITLSNDGINTVCTRGTNLLDDPSICKMLKKIKHLAVESVTSQYNYDYALLFKYIEDKLGEDVDIFVDKLRITWDMPTDIYNIPLDDYDNKLRSLADEALKDLVKMKDTKATRLFVSSVEFILNGDELHLPKCGAFYNSLNIDCVGNIYTCHNSGERIGHINEDRDIVANRYEDWLSNHLNEECKDCSVYTLCGGGCPLEHDYRQKICSIYKVFYSVCLDLANAYLDSFEKIDWSVANNA